MDKFEFLEAVASTFEDCLSEEAIEHRANEMIKMIESQKELSKMYLQSGIL